MFPWIALNPSLTIMHYNGITSTYKDASEWAAFITALFEALEERYTAEEVRRWRIEVWNEPQGCGFFCPAPGVSNLDGYFELYNTTATDIAAVDPLISVGGPPTAALDWVPEFINFTQGGAAVPAHFLSTHSYPTDYSTNLLTRTIWEGLCVLV